MFTISVILAFIVGFAMLGAMTFLPTFLQYVDGVSATVSGLQILPLVVGLLLTSIASGTVIGRTGRYRWFPIVGTLLMAVGLWLLSTHGRLHAAGGSAPVYMLVLGCGIGLSMQVLTIIVQNTAAYRDLGVATSGVTFFRTLGSSFGASIFGTVYANVLSNHLPGGVRRVAWRRPDLDHHARGSALLPAGADHGDRRRLRPRAPGRLPRGRAGRVGRVRAGVVPQGGAAPRQHAGRGGRRGRRLRDARAQRPGTPPRARHRPAPHRVTRDDLIAIWREAGTRLGVADGWCLAQVHARADLGIRPTLESIALRVRVPQEVLAPAFAAAMKRGYLVDHDNVLALTETGRAEVAQLVRARRAWLARELSDWGAEDDALLAEALDNISRRLLDETTGRSSSAWPAEPAGG